MIIRKGKNTDIDELKNLYDELNDYLEATINYPGWIKHIYPVRETAMKGINDGTLFVLQINDTIAGSIILNNEPEEAYNQAKWKVDTDYKEILIVRTLVVHPDFMDQGIASRLMDFSKEYAYEQKIKSIRLDVSVNNTAAIKLYEKHGYEYIGTVDLGLDYEHLKWFRLYELLL